MNKQLAKLSVTRSADYYGEVVKTLEDAGFVLVLETETSTDRYYIVAKSEDKKEIAIKSSTIEEPNIEKGRMTEEELRERLLHIKQIGSLTAKDREALNRSIKNLNVIPYIFKKLRDDIDEYKSDIEECKSWVKRYSSDIDIRDLAKEKLAALDYVLATIDNIQEDIEL